MFKYIKYIALFLSIPSSGATYKFEAPSYNPKLKVQVNNLSDLNNHRNGCKLALSAGNLPMILTSCSDGWTGISSMNSYLDGDNSKQEPLFKFTEDNRKSVGSPRQYEIFSSYISKN